MSNIVDRRRIDQYGGPNAIIYHQPNITTERTYLIAAVSPLLFYAPDRYHRQLCLIDPNSFFDKQAWPQFIAALEDPWNNFILYVSSCLIHHSLVFYCISYLVSRQPSFWQ